MSNSSDKRESVPRAAEVVRVERKNGTNGVLWERTYSRYGLLTRVKKPGEEWRDHPNWQSEREWTDHRYFDQRLRDERGELLPSADAVSGLEARVAQLEAERQRLIEEKAEWVMLARRIEWSDTWSDTRDGFPLKRVCPFCYATKDAGHHGFCLIGIALAKYDTPAPTTGGAA